MMKTSARPKSRDILQNVWPVLFKSIMVIKKKKKGKTEKVEQARGD